MLKACDDATSKRLAPHELKAKFLAGKLLEKNSSLSSLIADTATNANPTLNLSVFETFKPSKSRIVDKIPQKVTNNNDNVNKRSYSKVKGIFTALASTKGLYIDHLPGTGAKQSTDSNVIINKKNQLTVTRYQFGSGCSGSILNVKLDVEANYDLRPLITCNGILNYNSTVRSYSLQQKLREWDKMQRNWIYPEQQVTIASLHLAGSSSVSNELSLHEYWREPLPSDISAVGVTKRRRLKWQTALCSALDQLLNRKPISSTSNSKFISEEFRSFYVLGQDAESINSSTDTSTKSFNISAMFFRHKRKDNSSTIQEDEKGIEVSCILIGVKQILIDRLIDLGAIPMAMVDDKEAKRIEAKTRKKANPHVGSLGLLEVFCI